MQDVINLKAKAKINLYLEITGKTEDGYHLLDSLVCFADDIFDTISLKKSDKFELSYTGHFIESLPQDNKSNLLYKAFKLLNNSINYKLTLDKKIPIGAGLGGGSSDAATLCKYFGFDQEKELLKLGSDVPVCYHSHAGYFTGRGAFVYPAKLPKAYLLLVNPNIFCSTKEIFGKVRVENAPPTPKTFDFKGFGEFISYLKSRKNHLEEASAQLYPEIRTLIEAISNSKNCKLARMTGSGSTCFGIFEHEVEALEAKAELQKTYPNYWVRTSAIS